MLRQKARRNNIIRNSIGFVIGMVGLVVSGYFANQIYHRDFDFIEENRSEYFEVPTQEDLDSIRNFNGGVNGPDGLYHKLNNYKDGEMVESILNYIPKKSKGVYI
jgi:hypothetical protein